MFDFSKTFIGVVEDRNDPLKLGRCKVRIFGYHSESKELLPTKDLPWAIPIQPITSAAISGIGSAPLGPLPGTWVIGLFLDGEDCQQPAMFGTIASTSGVSFEPVAGRPLIENKDLGIVKDKDGNPIPDAGGRRMTTGRHGVEGWHLGQTSERYESGGNGPGTINNYLKSNDYGGASYGTYQFASFLPREMPNGNFRASSKNSPLLQYLATSKFKEKFAGLTPATPAFDQMWRTVAKENQNPDRTKDAFWVDQHEYVQKVYYNTCIANIQRTGIDLSKFGASVQDLVWSCAVQLGPANTKVFTEPLRGKAQLTDAEIVKMVTQYKVDNVGTLFRSSSQAIRDSVVGRWKSEEKDLLSLITA
jgi:hypothetical protein